MNASTGSRGSSYAIGQVSQTNRRALTCFPSDGRLAVTFVAKGPDKSAAQLQQERLADADDVARWKALWKEQLAHLATYLGEEPSRP